MPQLARYANYATVVATFVFGSMLMSVSPVFADDCSSICSGKGYTDNHCDGTAPFCNGGCYDGSGDDENQPYWANGTGYIDCPGHCTDGNGCWSGSKQCSCWNSIDCQNLCMHGSANRYNNLFAYDWACELRMLVDLSGCTDCAVRIIGACGWSDDEEGVQSCYCLYGPEDYVPE